VAPVPWKAKEVLEVWGHTAYHERGKHKASAKNQDGGGMGKRERQDWFGSPAYLGKSGQELKEVRMNVSRKEEAVQIAPLNASRVASPVLSCMSHLEK
jgi:hypothetical protein